MNITKLITGYRFSSQEGDRHWFKWGQVEVARDPGLSFIVSKPADHHEEECGHFSIKVWKIYLMVRLPFVRPFKDESYCSESRWWGMFFHPFMSDHKHISIYYGGETAKYIDMPWQWEFVGRGDESAKERRQFYCKYEDKMVDAVTFTQEFYYRWKWLQWFKPWKITVKRVDIEFSEEVGSRCGTWKGGTLGLSCPIGIGQSVESKLNELQAKGV